MKILVLGSSGQIGAPLVARLKDLKHDVFEFDIELDPTEDLRIPGILDNLLGDIDFVFFLAFDVGGSEYLRKYQDSYDFISNNIKIMNNVFDSLRRFNTPFIFTSTQMSGMTNSTYGILKNIGEKYTRSLNGMIVKLWNVYGYEKDLKKSHVITDFILMAKAKYITMKTTGYEKRQFLYVDDCRECLITLMDKFNEIKEREFDISSFEWISIIDLAWVVSSFFNNSLVCAGNQIDDVQRDALIEPRKDILKYWKPTTTIETGIRNLIELYKYH